MCVAQNQTAEELKRKIAEVTGGSGQGFRKGFQIFRRKVRRVLRVYSPAVSSPLVLLLSLIAAQANDNGDGKIDFGEFKRVLETLNMRISDEEGMQVFRSIDTDGSGAVAFSL